MKKLIEKFQKIEKRLSVLKGDFALFGLFLREESADKWDVVVSAPWLDADRKQSLETIAAEIQSTLTKSELNELSRIAIIDGNNPALETLRRAIQIEHGNAEIQNSDFFGLKIKHAYLITSQAVHSDSELVSTR